MIKSNLNLRSKEDGVSIAHLWHMFLAASLEKVSASIREESRFSFSTIYAIFTAMVVVMPAPARISWGAWVCFIDSSWRGFRVERRESNKDIPPF